MIKLNLSDLQPGMLTSTTIYSKLGQLLLPAHTILSTQQISHLAYYGIEAAEVFSDEELTPLLWDEAEALDAQIPTYSQRIKSTPEFKTFQKNYTAKVAIVEDALNDIIKDSKPTDQEALLTQVIDLFQGNVTTLSIFDMLHNMREIDDSTYAHSFNVGLIGRMLGQWLDLPREDLDLITLCGLLHDIGKCKVDPAIIQKPGKLTSTEYQEIQKHPAMGYEMLKHRDLDPHIKFAALMHHERCDGTGYPLGIEFKKIDTFAQIISIADVYDAMTANRCYRHGLCPFEVIATFEKDGLDKYNPKFILTFLEHIVDTYIHNDVLLSNGKRGRIVLINKLHLSQPVVQLLDGDFLNLAEHPELFISKIL